MPDGEQQSRSRSRTSSRPVNTELGSRGTSKYLLQKRDGGVVGPIVRSQLADGSTVRDIERGGLASAILGGFVTVDSPE